MADTHPHPATPQDALGLLVDGNRRHQEGAEEARHHSPLRDPAAGQRPFAALITCSDSRLAPSRIFDVAPGNLFVTRVAGNGLDVGVIGSTEYAVKELGVKLVVVLGHTDCGAVKAAMAVAAGDEELPSKTHGSIREAILPVIEAVGEIPQDRRTPARCVARNAARQAEDLADPSRSPIVSEAVEGGELRVAAAVYDIGTGSVALTGED